MQDRFEIRPCRVRDIPGVLALWTRAASMASATDNEWALRARLRRDRDLFLVALDGAELVGTVMGGWDGWRGNIYRLAVAPEHRRRGLARRLVADVERRMREAGVERITALVVTGSPEALPFWRDAGYLPDDSVQRHFKTLT